jgi:hypothetical protein
MLYHPSYMKSVLRIPLQTSAEQLQRLLALQQVFARVCNTLAPTVREHRCWNRVALHHMTYKSLREQFPALGSQMVCNAIYSICRASRLVYQHPDSPFNIARLGDKPLPLLRFADNCPVYFDRHTLSLKGGVLSLFTLDGRMRFQLTLQPEAETAFQTRKLREIVLSRRASGEFELSFWLEPAGQQGDAAAPVPDGELPEYLIVEEQAA